MESRPAIGHCLSLFFTVHVVGCGRPKVTMMMTTTKPTTTQFLSGSVCVRSEPLLLASFKFHVFDLMPFFSWASSLAWRSTFGHGEASVRD